MRDSVIIKLSTGTVLDLTQEEKAWIIEQVKFVENIKVAYKDREDDIYALEDSLRKIDNHIRSTKDPIKHIIKVLKDTLPEYQGEFY